MENKDYLKEEKKEHRKEVCKTVLALLAIGAVATPVAYGAYQGIKEDWDRVTHPFYQKEATLIGQKGNTNIGLFDLDGDLSTCEAEGRFLPSTGFLNSDRNLIIKALMNEYTGKKMKICDWQKKDFWISRKDAKSEYQNGK